MKLSGLAGKILRVNLISGEITAEPTPEHISSMFFGGRGLGAYILYNEAAPEVDPLGPDNLLIFANGPLAGTMAPGNNKICVTFKAPLTNTYSYSLCGGHLGPEIKFAGYDALVVKGRAENPVCLWIDDGSVSIRPAGHLWGQLVPDTESQLKEELGDPFIENIGLLGANCGVSDWEHLCRATEICDTCGMDAMAVGAAVSMIMEAYEKGRIKSHQLDGLEPRFGDGKSLVELVQRIADRKGIGDLLAGGVKEAAEKLGVPDLAIHVKGLPLSTYDPRGCKGMALTYGTCPKGAHHMYSPTIGPNFPDVMQMFLTYAVTGLACLVLLKAMGFWKKKQY